MVRRTGVLFAVLLVAAMIALVLISMPVNDRFYGLWVNYDPQGDAELHEAWATAAIYRYTAGVLCGQFLSLVAGFVLGRRRRWAGLAAAGAAAAVLAAVTVAVAIPLARSYGGTQPVPVRLLAVELAAYPLWAAVGAGAGALLTRARLRRGRDAVLVAAVSLWWIAALVGLVQDDAPGFPPWSLWLLPSLAAGTAIAQAGLSLDVYADPPVLAGDWGHAASIALVGGLTIYAGLAGLLVGRANRRSE
jgi:hypothetical protein